MKKRRRGTTTVYGASVSGHARVAADCSSYVSCPCDVETNPCAYCACAPRSCSCRTIAVAAITEEHDPIMLAILRAMAEGKTVAELLEQIKTRAKSAGISG